MRFSDFVAYHALQENNRCLQLLSDCPAALSDNAIHRLRVGVKRLRASWALVRREVDEPLFDAANARLASIHRVLGVPRDERALLVAARDLHGKATKPRTQTALARVAESFVQDGCSVPVSRASIRQVSAGFQQESSAWRDLDVEHMGDRALIGGYLSSYRHGRRLGRRVLRLDDDGLMHGWRRWVKFTFYQLDMIRPALCAENRARRWYLERLGDCLGKHHDLVLLRQRLGAVPLDDDDCQRVVEMLETRLKVFRNRAKTLYPYIYTQKGHDFGEGIARDVQRLTFDHVAPLSRSA